MSLISFVLICSVINPSYVIYRCSVNILIYLYGKLNCFAFTLWYSNIPCNSSAGFCSAILCRYKLGVFRQLICDCSVYILTGRVLVSDLVCEFFFWLYYLTVYLGCCTTFEHFLLWLGWRWVMSLISFVLICSIINLSYVIDRCSVNILIHLYSEFYCFAFTLWYSNIPCNSSAGFCSAILCRYKLGVFRQLICDCSVYILTGRVLVSDLVCEFFFWLYYLTIYLSCCTALEYFFLWLGWRMYLYRF